MGYRLEGETADFDGETADFEGESAFLKSFILNFVLLFKTLESCLDFTNQVSKSKFPWVFQNA